ncbi:hypothetical protein RMATCC62417_10343 [Rhizopus microsporus]|nr:hypothetical protein RMATCC62417_10343 [Rhizopus microsporus]
MIKLSTVNLNNSACKLLLQLFILTSVTYFYQLILLHVLLNVLSYSYDYYFHSSSLTTVSKAPTTNTSTIPKVDTLVYESVAKQWDDISLRQRRSSSSTIPTSSSCTSLVLSPSSSTTSLGSHWSTDSKRSRVAELIHLFETGSHPEQRRHSIDTCYYFHSRCYIQQRRFEYIPTLKEWEKREDKRPPIQLVSSQSTPVKRLVKKRETKINDTYSQRKVTSTRDLSWTPTQRHRSS